MQTEHKLLTMIIPTTKRDVLQEIFYDSFANQSSQTLAVRCSLKLLANVQCTSTRKRVV